MELMCSLLQHNRTAGWRAGTGCARNITHPRFIAEGAACVFYLIPTGYTARSLKHKKTITNDKILASNYLKH